MRYNPRWVYRTEPSEDSDLILALFRLAFVIAFTLSSMASSSSYNTSWVASTAGIVAAVYTLLLMVGYWYNQKHLTQRRKQALRAHPLGGVALRYRLGVQRISALILDFAVFTAIIHDVGRWPEAYRGGLLFDLYFVPIVAAGLWYHRGGGIVAALLATLCVMGLLTYSESYRLDIAVLRSELPARAAMFLAGGLVTGYLARAAEAERRERSRMNWELGMARQVQSSLLPQELPALLGYELAVRFYPADVVGGDYYDALIGPDGRLLIAIADVAGKSVYAVMHLSLLRSTLRDAALEGLAPQAIALRLNQKLVATLPPNTFISLFCAAIELPSGQIRFVNAGHMPPLLLPVDEKTPPRSLFTGNIVLGVDANATYEEAEATMAAGETLICCTDGIAEAIMTSEGEMGRMESIVATARTVENPTAERLAEVIANAARAYSLGPLVDDATVLVIHRSGSVSHLES
ncbi:MAG: PP2C family protein-serine/threonine phosphatase [Candidatus Zipacnadales bacterium]